MMNKYSGQHDFLGRTDGDDLEALFAQAGHQTGISDRNTLVRDGLRLLIARESARQLAALGGTMPDFAAPPRSRPDASVQADR